MSDDEVRETCAGGVVVREEAGRREVCLVLRDRHGPRTWGLPKGHLEPGERLTEAARREVREETGLAGDIVASLQPIRYRFRVKDDPRVHAKTVHFFLIKALCDGLNHAELLRPGLTPSYCDRHVVAVHFYHNLMVVLKGHNDEGSLYIRNNASDADWITKNYKVEAGYHPR